MLNLLEIAVCFPIFPYRTICPFCPIIGQLMSTWLDSNQRKKVLQTFGLTTHPHVHYIPPKNNYDPGALIAALLPGLAEINE